MSTKRKLKREAKRLKKEQAKATPQKPMKVMDALREIFVKPPPKKYKPRPDEIIPRRFNYRDFTGRDV